MRRLLVVTLALLLALAACGREPEAPLNAEDVMFVQMMVQHHRQGIALAALGASRAASPELRTLTAAVQATQQDEVEMMLRWLHAWGQPLTAPSGAHDHHGGMPETDATKIRALKRSRSFDRDLATLLISHQGDAVRMAGTELSGGANPEVKAWAERVRASRDAQIEQLRGLLAR